MIDIIKVSSRGQIVIPDAVRKRLNIIEGTKLVLIEKENKLILESEKTFMEELRTIEKEKEMVGWLALAEQSMAKLWDNPKDEKVWQRYL